MKKTYLFIALAMVAAMTVSCKNNKKAKEAAKATEEVVEAAKTILADDVLATIDELAQTIFAYSGTSTPDAIISSALTEEEKLIKPDYLLEAAQANEMVTKSQKLNALSILLIERHIRIAYGMPTEETDEVIARFSAEINALFSFDERQNLTPSERVKRAYEAHKENGDIAAYWQFALAAQTELDYLVSKNVDVFFRNLTEDQYSAYTKKFKVVTDAARILAEHDLEVKQVWDAFNAGGEIITDLSKESIEYGKNHFIEKAAVKAARRAEMLK